MWQILFKYAVRIQENECYLQPFSRTHESEMVPISHWSSCHHLR